MNVIKLTLMVGFISGCFIEPFAQDNNTVSTFSDQDMALAIPTLMVNRIFSVQK